MGVLWKVILNAILVGYAMTLPKGQMSSLWEENGLAWPGSLVVRTGDSQSLSRGSIPRRATKANAHLAGEKLS